MTNDNKVVGMESIIDLIWTTEDVSPASGPALPPEVLANCTACSGGIGFECLFISLRCFGG